MEEVIGSNPICSTKFDLISVVDNFLGTFRISAYGELAQLARAHDSHS